MMCIWSRAVLSAHHARPREYLSGEKILLGCVKFNCMMACSNVDMADVLALLLVSIDSAALIKWHITSGSLFFCCRYTVILQ